jgi:hypothetical protein
VAFFLPPSSQLLNHVYLADVRAFASNFIKNDAKEDFAATNEMQRSVIKHYFG